MLSSQETWLRQQRGDSDAWLMPTNNGVARIVKPPLLVWLNLAGWADLTPETATPEDQIFRARLVSVGTGLIMLAAIYWLGMSLGGLRLAVLAALTAGAILFVQRQIRTASYDIEYSAWATLSVAAAVWALGPLQDRVPAGRRWIGWGVSGVAMGLSWMTKNPLALVLTIPPILAAMMAFPGREGNQRRNWAGLAISAVTCLAVVAPWHLYVLLYVPDAVETLVREFKQSRGNDPQVPYYYVGTFGLLFPWCIGIIAGLYHPFDGSWIDDTAMNRSRQEWIRLWPLIWFIMLFAFFSSVAAKQQRYILPIVAPAALLVARVWCDQAVTVARGPGRVNVKLLSWPHWIILLATSLGPIVLGMADIAGWRLPMEIRDSIPFSGAWSVGLGLLLVAISVAGWYLQDSGRIFGGGMMTAAWGLTLSAPFWFGYCRQPTDMDHTTRAARTLRAEIEASGRPASSLRYVDVFPTDLAPEEEFRLYYGDFIPAASKKELSDPTVTDVIAEPIDSHRILLSSLGYRMIRSIPEGKNSTREYWSRRER